MIGEIYDIVQGINANKYVKVISEPFYLGDNSKYVSVIDSNDNEYDIELEELLYSNCYKLRVNKNGR